MLRNFDDSVLSEYIGHLKEDAKRIKINVLLLGPGTNKEKQGAKLRKYISRKCNRKSERNAIYGERKDLIEAFQKAIKYSDLCTYELHLVKNWANAIIIIPDSAGSLVELGLFALEDNIHPKTLVLFSNKYNPHDEPDFISLGPKQSYTNGRAFIETVDYGDKELVWNIVDEFLSKMKSRKFSKNLRL